MGGRIRREAKHEGWWPSTSIRFAFHLSPLAPLLLPRRNNLYDHRNAGRTANKSLVVVGHSLHSSSFSPSWRRRRRQRRLLFPSLSIIIFCIWEGRFSHSRQLITLRLPTEKANSLFSFSFFPFVFFGVELTRNRPRISLLCSTTADCLSLSLSLHSAIGAFSCSTIRKREQQENWPVGRLVRFVIFFGLSLQ